MINTKIFIMHVIIPYNKNKNTFNISNNVEYLGYGICNWKLNEQFDPKYLKISIILMDTKYLIDNFFNKDKDASNLLAENIEKVELE